MIDYFDLHNIQDNATKIQRFKLSLEGQARVWLDSTRESMTFENLSQEFVKHFDGITSHQSNLHRFRSLKWDEVESLEQYGI